MERNQGNAGVAGKPRRGLGLLALVAGAVLLAGCSADGSGDNGGSTPTGAAPKVSLTSSPSTVTGGTPVTLTWTTTDATSCVASGSWTGNKAINGSEAVTAPTAPGTYTYTLTCTGANQQTGSGSATVTVSTATTPPPAVTIGTSPGSTPAGGNVTLTWTTTNAVSCVASGAWTGNKAINGSEAVIAPTTPGNYTYTLTCTGPTNQQGAASATLVVTAAAGQTPTVSLTANPASLVASSTATTTLTWTTTNADTCVASGDWSGSRATSGNFTTAPLTAPRIYTYTLTCTNAVSGFSASSTTNVTVTDFAVMCPTAGQTYSGIHLPNATTASTNVIGLCVGCTVTDEANVIDNDPNYASYAVMSIPVGLLGGAQDLTATSTSTVFPIASAPGFIVADPSSQLLTLTLLRGVTVSTLKGGTLTGDSAGAGEALQLDILGLLLDGKKAFVSIPSTTKTYDSVRLTQTAGLVGAISTIRVYDAGVCQ